MPKVIIPMGFEPELFAEIERQRGEESRTAFVNRKLKEIMVPNKCPTLPL